MRFKFKCSQKIKQTGKENNAQMMTAYHQTAYDICLILLMWIYDCFVVEFVSSHYFIWPRQMLSKYIWEECNIFIWNILCENCLTSAVFLRVVSILCCARIIIYDMFFIHPKHCVPIYFILFAINANHKNLVPWIFNLFIVFVVYCARMICSDSRHV